MRYHAIAFGLTLILLSAGVAQASEIYKWVDEQGNVHYEDRPDGIMVERVDIDSRPTDPARIQAMAQARAMDRARATEAKAEADAKLPTAAELKEEADERAKKCTSSKSQLVSYVNNRRLYKMTAEGEREYLSDAEITATRDRAAQQVDEFCN